MVITAFVRSTSKHKPANIRIRLRDGRDFQRFGTIPHLSILPENWDKRKEQVKERSILCIGENRNDINSRVREAKERIETSYRFVKNKYLLPPDWIDRELGNDKLLQKGKNVDGASLIISAFEKYIETNSMSESRKRAIHVTCRILQRYLTIHGIMDVRMIKVDDLEFFIKNEHQYAEEYPDIYRGVKKRQEKGDNTVIDKLKKIRAFFNSDIAKKQLMYNPFNNYKMKGDLYGDPISLTKQELETILQANLPDDLCLERDMFCLQCFCGCRISDFVNLTKNNLQDDVLLYIPSKTIKENAKTVFVPLPDQAMDIIRRHEQEAGERLFPFTKNIYGKTGYAFKIRKILEVLKLDRNVIVLNPVTRNAETKKLYEVVSTHTARRTFTHLNYTQSKDPALVAKMTGHSENSRSFSRYRKIDIDILKEQIKKVF